MANQTFWLPISVFLLLSKPVSATPIFTAESRANIAGTIQIGAGGSAQTATTYSGSFYTTADCSGSSDTAEGDPGSLLFSPNTSVNISAAGLWTLAYVATLDPQPVHSFSLMVYDNTMSHTALFSPTPCFAVTCSGTDCIGSTVQSVTMIAR